MLFLTLFCLIGVSHALPANVKRTHDNQYVLTNGYVAVNVSSLGIKSLTGDMAGVGDYGEELLARSGFTLESNLKNVDRPAATVTVTSNTSSLASVTVSGVTAGSATETWLVSLTANSRSLVVNTTGRNAPTQRGEVIAHSIEMTPLSVYGFYPDSGVTQMMNSDDDHSHMLSARPLSRGSHFNYLFCMVIEIAPCNDGLTHCAMASVYSIGGVNPNTQNSANATKGSVDIRRIPLQEEITALISQHSSTAFLEVVSGTAQP